MDKIIALTLLLLPQPLIAYLIYFAMDKALSLMDIENSLIIIIVSVIWYIVFAFLFARGFLSSNEAKKLGFSKDS